jgi:hypothetical protein
MTVYYHCKKSLSIGPFHLIFAPQWGKRDLHYPRGKKRYPKGVSKISSGVTSTNCIQGVPIFLYPKGIMKGSLNTGGGVTVY